LSVILKYLQNSDLWWQVVVIISSVSRNLFGGAKRAKAAKKSFNIKNLDLVLKIWL
jgi:hypothetical protein